MQLTRSYSQTLILAVSFHLVLFTSFTIAHGGATHQASSNTDAAVQRAINLASDGDTVIIPEGKGTVIWNNRDVVDRAITLRGPGKNKLVIDCRTATKARDSTPAGRCLDVNLSSGNFWRITGISITETNELFYHYDGVIAVRGSTNGRIDHCDFTNLNARVGKIFLTIGTALLFDNNTVNYTDTNGSVLYIEPADREVQWDTPTSWGSVTDSVTIEDNTFIKTHSGSSGSAIDGGYGAKIIFRFNTTKNLRPLVHGREANMSRSAMRFEVYENNIIDDAHTDNRYYTPITYRGGSGAAFNNSITGEIDNGRTPFWTLLIGKRHLRSRACTI